MRRSLALLLSGVFAVSLMAASLISTTPVSAATIAPTTTCNNALGNGGAVCEVTVVNTITPSGGSAVVTVRECTGSAGVPDATCSVTTSPVSQPVTAVTQCNGSINGGGGQLRCSIEVTNNFMGISPSPTVTAVTVNQCVGTVTTGTVMNCSPYPATTTGATITQCNGSGNGGGASLTCTASGTQSSGLVVQINQCNGSTNGGGTLTVCSASITNVVVAATPTATPVPAAAATPAPAAPTATPVPAPGPLAAPGPTATPAAGAPGAPAESAGTPAGGAPGGPESVDNAGAPIGAPIGAPNAAPGPNLPDTSFWEQVIAQATSTVPLLLAGLALAGLALMTASRPRNALLRWWDNDRAGHS